VSGIDADADFEQARRRASGAAADAVRAVLADLDRRWKVPPAEFAREFAAQMIAAVLERPDLVETLARLLARELIRAALKEPRLLDALADELAGRK
jgi:hypothetical protein